MATQFEIRIKKHKCPRCNSELIATVSAGINNSDSGAEIDVEIYCENDICDYNPIDSFQIENLLDSVGIFV